MFKDKEKRFLTRAISETVPVEIQVTLWRLIDSQCEKGVELDYLQVFDLEINGLEQQVTHCQEFPESNETSMISLHSTEPINLTVWCIDSGNYQIMLFPEDY